MEKNWQTTTASGNLVDSRLQLHWAAQVIASVGGVHVAPEADDSHRNMEWIAKSSMFVGNLSGGEKPFRITLHPESLELRLLDGSGNPQSSLPLSDNSLDAAYQWAAEAICTYTGDEAQKLVRPEYELPDHSVANGGVFNVPTSDLASLSHWFGNSDMVLRAISSEDGNFSPVRCWPHHFDIGGLLTLTAESDPEVARSVGMGMTPGDGSYPEPYWYISPWPYPKDGDLPELPVGNWHTEGWTGAVLTASEIESETKAVEQAKIVTTFSTAAVAAATQVALRNAT